MCVAGYTEMEVACFVSLVGNIYDVISVSNQVQTCIAHIIFENFYFISVKFSLFVYS